MYWLCDQGLKRDNNSLRWEQTPQMQKQRRRMRFRNLKKMYHENQVVEEEGEPVVLGANYKKSKRWYDQQYQDSIAVALKYESFDDILALLKGIWLEGGGRAKQGQRARITF